MKTTPIVMTAFFVTGIVLSGCVTYEVVEKKSITPTPRIISTPGVDGRSSYKPAPTKWWQQNSSETEK